MKWIVTFVFFLAFAAGPALAEPLSSHPTSGELASACSKAGGSFNSHDVNSALPGAYSCTKQNCDGKGGNCKVECSEDADCYGHTPSRLRAATLVGILQNGNMVVHTAKPADLNSAATTHDNPILFNK